MVEETGTPRVYYHHLNFNGFLGNDTIRQAVLMSIDSELIVSNVMNNSINYGFSIIPSNLDYGYEELTNTYAYDLEKAIKLLDDAGIVDTDGDGIRELDGENIVISFATKASETASQAQVLSINELGIKCELDIYESVVPNVNSGDFDIAVWGELVTPTGDPAKFMSHWYSKSTDNYGGYVNEEYDEIYELLVSEFDTEKRREYLIDLQQILLDDAATIVTGYQKINVSYQKGLTGLNTTPTNFYWITPELRFGN